MRLNQWLRKFSALLSLVPLATPSQAGFASRVCAVFIVLLFCFSGWARGVELPLPEYVGVGERDGQQRIMMTFADPLPVDIRLADHVSVRSGAEVYDNWQFGPERKVVWLSDVTEKTRVDLSFINPDYNTTVFSDINGGQLLLAAQLPELDVIGRGPVLPLQEKPGLPLRFAQVDAVQLELLRVDNPRLVAQQLSPFDSVDEYTLNSISGALQSLGVSERLPEVETVGESEATLPLPMTQPGWYFAVLKPAGRFGSESSVIRQVLYTDLAIRVLRFDSGIGVSVTRFTDGEPVGRAQVTVSMPDQSDLIQALVNGSTFFSGNFEDNTLITVETDEDVSYLPLSSVPLDLSDYRVAGADSSRIEVFATANRDLVAPGASITVTAVLRGHDGASVDSQPLTVKWQDPNGEIVSSERLHSREQGVWQFEHRLSDGARPGRWQALFFTDPNGSVLGDFEFNVDDFVPERISMDLPELPMHSPIQSKLPLAVSAQYLHGAAAAGLQVEADLIFSSAWRDAVPGWFVGERFDLYESYRRLSPDALDENGLSALSLAAPDQDVTAPVRATVSVSVLDGESVVQRQRSTVLWPADTMIGIKPEFAADQIAYNATAVFDIAAFELGESADEPVQVSVSAYRDIGSGFWVFDDALGWTYQRQYGQQPIYNNQLTLNGRPQSVAFDVEWGAYQIVVTDHSTGTKSSYSFYAGWSREQDRALIPNALDARISSLDPAQLEIDVNAPFAGSLQVQLVTDRPVLTQQQDLDGGQQKITIDARGVEDRLDAYLVLTLTDVTQQKPARSLAILPLRWPRHDRQLSPQFELPEEWRPNSLQHISVAVPGVDSGIAWLMVADKGITNITDFSPSDPFDFFYRKRKLDAELHDLHQRFYDQLDAQLTRTRSGGDTVLKRDGIRAEATERLTLLHTSELVPIVNGQAEFELLLPEYTGEAMVSVVAINDDHFGQQIKSQRIATPIALEWRAPKTMVPGDVLSASVLLRNNQSVTQTIELALSSEPPIAARLSAYKINLAPQQQQRVPLTLSVARENIAVGAASISITARSDDERTDLNQQIFIRSPGGLATSERRFSIAANDTVLLNNTDASQWLNHEQQILVSTGFALDVSKHYQRLVEFPYGCSEQIVSQVSGLLLGNSEIDRITGATNADTLLDAAVIKLFQRQLSGGGISLWDDGGIAEWVTVYAADFLQRLAAIRNEPTLDDRLRRLLDQVHRFVGQPGRLNSDSRASVVAYASLISARAGMLNLTTLDQAVDAVGDDFTPTATAQLAHAYFLLGDQMRAETLIDTALNKDRTRYHWYGDYGSELSDAALLLTTIGEMRDQGWHLRGNHATRASDRLQRALSSRQWYSTQERLRLLQAASLWAPQGNARISVDGQERDFFGSMILTGGINQLKNYGSEPLYVTRRQSGYRKLDLPIESDTLKIEQRFYHADGTPASLQDVSVGDLIIVSNQLNNSGAAISNALFVDPLPAGFVLENPRLGQGINLSVLQSDEFDPASEEMIDYQRFEVKRYSAIFNLQRKLNLVYQMRAVSSGRFSDPGPTLEDLYSPERRTATGSNGRLTVRR